MTAALSSVADRQIALVEPMTMCPQALRNRTTQVRRQLSAQASQKTQPFPVWYSRRSIQAMVPRFAEVYSRTTASCDHTILKPACAARRKKSVSSAPDNAKLSSNLGTLLNTCVPTSTLWVAHVLHRVPVVWGWLSKNPPAFIQPDTSGAYRATTGPETTSAANSACAQRSSSNHATDGTSSSSMNATKSTAPASSTARFRA